MILSAIKSYLQQRGQATLTDIAIHVDSTPDAVRGMLEMWIAKGKVQRQQMDETCGSCCKCEQAATEIYIWNGSPALCEDTITKPDHCDKH
ncbi:MAG: FeoC-like transcriptional regulator [Chromatiales bacterium]|nr:FeoC-like transcriptional regulator [Chromatiales bacterium]